MSMLSLLFCTISSGTMIARSVIRDRGSVLVAPSVYVFFFSLYPSTQRDIRSTPDYRLEPCDDLDGSLR